MMHQQGQQPLGQGGGAGLKFGQMGSNNNGIGQQQQQHGGVAANGGGSQDAASSANQAPEYTLAGVLHYLQSEWRRYEKDRNEWEIERAEMRARIALLEGEKRGAENLKTNLMRRVKMLEFALKQERSKYLAGASGPAAAAGAAPVAKHPAVANLEKESTLSSAGSGRSSPIDFGEQQQHHARAGTAASAATIPTLNGSISMAPSLLNRQLSTNTTSSATSKDYRSRERSREYLKQCLQEISYLTSSTTLNPLPDRPMSGAASFVGGPPRPKKTLIDEPPPPPAAATEDVESGSVAGEGLDATVAPAEEATAAPSDEPSSSAPSMFRSTGGVEDWEKLKQAGQEGRLKRENERKAAAAAAAGAGVGAAAVEASGVVASSSEDDHTGAPETLSSERAKRLLREASSLSSTSSTGGGDDSLDDEVDAASKESQLWRMKRHLAHHRGAVKAIAFDQGAGGDEAVVVVSASSDRTIKVARVERTMMHGGAAPRGQQQNAGVVATLEGHSNLVTSVTVSSARRRIYSGSIDSTLKVWAIPDVAAKSANGRREEGSEDDSTEQQQPLVVQPLASIKTDSEITALTLLPSTAGDDSLLATASADGMVRLYSLDPTADDATTDAAASASSGPHLLHTWDYFGLSPSPSSAADREKESEALRQESGGLPVPTSIVRVHSKLRECAVSYSNCVVKTFRLSDGQEVSKLGGTPEAGLSGSYDQTPATQINCLASHPTLPLLFTGHEDKWLRIVDVFTGSVVGSCHAHKEGVTSLDVDPSGLKLLSAGHDGWTRLWDLSRLGGELDESGSEASSDGGSKKSKRKEEGIVLTQEIQDHSKSEGEGVLAVKFHPTLPFFGSAGADGVVRIYG
ncbi:WD40 repeat-like protein [Jaminaea rosea]|uniref:WD40 repeat-like protein n=1 Tax=Jaminaea rosea TaxID=1569628 RepID=A0A316UUE6_9BASI|nr:WD40 repeat-like protein [Jaminaea rosea]PWN28418.1 WD40 repeat-like protein [Jaminaea rosea]